MNNNSKGLTLPTYNITLRDLLDNQTRLAHLTQKLIDYAANKQLSLDEVCLTLTISNVYEGKEVKCLELAGSGIC